MLNLDARYEWYFGAGEYFSAGVFYKDIDKPVEAVLNGRSGSNWQQSFINAPSATVMGQELDYRKYFDSPFSWTGDGRLFRSEKHTSDLQSLMRSAYAGFFFLNERYNKLADYL